MTRKEHLEWAKQRALEYIASGNIKEAYVSMVSDLNKHPQTQGHVAIELGMMLMTSGNLDSPIKMREFIQGFN